MGRMSDRESMRACLVPASLAAADASERGTGERSTRCKCVDRAPEKGALKISSFIKLTIL